MDNPASTFLAPWSNYYVITGSSAAALTGLMFVVITLIADTERLRNSPDGVGTFSSPTVVHFCAALLISAILSAPWRLLVHPAALLALVGFTGVAYGLRVAFRMRRTSTYLPELDDWAWYAIFPIIAYAIVLVSSIALTTWPIEALFGFAGANIFLVFIGIRNAWDVVTYIAIGMPEHKSDKSSK